MDAHSTVGICCRVWLPDVVLPAGQSLRLALEGVDGSNFSHLKTKYPSAEFKVFGAASLALPPAQRLHVAARCRDLAVLEQLEVDVLDLAETACDVVADTLNLSDEQVQDCFEKIRVEKHDTYFNAVAVAPRPGSGGKSEAPPGAISKSRPSVPKLDQFTLPPPKPLMFSPSIAPPLGQATPQAAPPPPPAQVVGQPLLAPPPVAPGGFPVSAAMPPSVQPQAQQVAQSFQQAAQQHLLQQQQQQQQQKQQQLQQQEEQLQQQQQLLQQRQQRQQRQQQKLQKQQQKLQMQQTQQQPMPPPAAPAAKEKKHKSKNKLDGQADSSKKRLDPQVVSQVPTSEQTRAEKKRAREDVASKEARKAQRKLEAAAFAAELRVPAPQASHSAVSPKGASPETGANGELPAPAQPAVGASAAAPDAAPAKPADAASAQPAAASSPSAPEAEDSQALPNSDPYLMPGAQGGEADGGEFDEGSESGSDEGSSYEEEDEVALDDPKQSNVAAVAPVRVKLFKLGDLCCDVWARFVSGNKKGGELSETMHIDQRVKVERCSEHFQWAGSQATVWRLTPTDDRGRDGYYALSEYFLEKGRVGLVETKWYAVYILPAALGKEYLSGLGITGTRRLVGLQVPTALTQ